LGLAARRVHPVADMGAQRGQRVLQLVGQE
jgi:hypothetical protein